MTYFFGTFKNDKFRLKNKLLLLIDEVDAALIEILFIRE